MRTYKQPTILAWVCLILVLQVFRPIYAQDCISSVAKLKTEKGEAKVDLLNELSACYRNVNLDSANAFALEAVSLGEQLKYNEGLAIAYKNLGTIHLFLGNLNQAKQSYLKSQSVFEATGNVSGAMDVNYNLGLLFYYKPDYDSAILYYNKDFEYRKEIDDQLGIADGYLNMGNVYWSKGEEIKALEYYKNSIEAFQNGGDTLQAIKGEFNIGNIYWDYSNYDLALESFYKCLPIFESNNDMYLMWTCLDNIGKVHLDLDNYGEAREYTRRALQTAQEWGDQRSITVTLQSMGALNSQERNSDSAHYYFRQSLDMATRYQYTDLISLNLNSLGILDLNDDELERAESYFLRSLEMKEELDINEYYLATSFENLGKIYEKRSDLNKAIDYYQKTLEIAESVNSNELRQNASFGLYKAYEKLNQPAQSLSHFVRYTIAKDSILNEQSQKNIANLEIGYQTARKDQEIQLQKAQLGTQQAIIKQQSLQRNLLLGGVASLLIIAVLGYYTYQSRLKTKELIYQNQKEMEQIRSRFFANISHEFRTPLTLITARVDDVIEQAGKKDLTDLKGIKKNALRLLQLVNQLLDLSKIDAQRTKLKVVQGNISSFIQALSESFHSLAVQRDIQFNIPSGELVIDGYFDQDKLEKIIVNLVSNAFKHTPEGGTITVSMYQYDSQHLTVTIEDTGRGIPPHDVEHIFDRFYQASDTDTGGSGIGLSLTKELIEIQKGQISVKSELDKGSQFTVTLPISRGHFEQLGAEISETKPEPTTEEKPVALPALDEDKPVDNRLLIPEDKPVILVAEDNTELRHYIKDMLSSEYSVMEAPNGKDALELAVTHQPDMVLSDVMMPEMDGTELCKHIKNTTETSHIPLIMLTAKASGEAKLEGLDIGADDYLTKPFDKKELKVRIKNLILQRRKLIEKFSQSLNPRDIKLNSADDDFMQRTASVIKARIDDHTFSVEGLGDEIGMSRSQLFKKIKALTGMSVSEYIRAIRLSHAAEMLKNKTASVSEIAYEVGFNNLSYFAKCFKERFGVSPSEYGLA
ncbi:MAG: tetratricopeptide repeat protein [Bacteroidota bacterium]